ncbi:MAG: FtsX-like permease family protein [Pseudomonadota bacterium]
MIKNIFQLALKSLRFRKITIGLTILSLAISIVLLFGVDIIRTQAKENFTNTVSDTDLIVGSRSGSVQLLLYSIFHIGSATNNVSWNSYNKIKSHPRVSWSVPISLGDSHKGFRVIGTTQDIFEHYRYGKGNILRLSSGERFSGLYDAVIGSKVANSLDYKITDKIVISHGITNADFAEHKDSPFTITGILKPTGTPLDRSILISLQGLEALHIGWETGAQNKSVDQNKNIDIGEESLEPESITAFLLGLKSKHDIFSIRRGINEFNSEPLLAIMPGIALLELWKVVDIIERTLLVISGLVVLTSLIGIFTVIITNLNERRREMAILRSVGASPKTIFSLMIIESEILVFLGVLFGLAFLYSLLAMINPILFNIFGFNIELGPPTKFQILMLVIILLGGFLAALYPAISAYRKTLQDGLTIRL